MAGEEENRKFLRVGLVPEQAGSNPTHQGLAFEHVSDLVFSGLAGGSRSLSRGKGKLRYRGLESEALLVVASSYRGYDVGGDLWRGCGRRVAGR